MIEEVLDNLNEAAGETYYYLCTDDGEILYHPRKAEIDRGFFTEDSSTAAGYADGTYEISVNGEKSNIVVNSLSYTGWKLVGVVPEGVQTASINKFRYYIIATAIILLMMLFVVNKIDICSGFMLKRASYVYGVLLFFWSSNKLICQPIQAPSHYYWKRAKNSQNQNG